MGNQTIENEISAIKAMLQTLPPENTIEIEHLHNRLAELRSRLEDDIFDFFVTFYLPPVPSLNNRYDKIDGDYSRYDIWKHDALKVLYLQFDSLPNLAGNYTMRITYARREREDGLERSSNLIMHNMTPVLMAFLHEQQIVDQWLYDSMTTAWGIVEESSHEVNHDNLVEIFRFRETNS